MARPFVSVIIPAFNEERYIGKTLESLSRQTLKGGYEIIVVDNASTDNTAKIARRHATKVLREPKKGYFPTVNRGIRAAKGAIIATCDADTLYPPEWLEKAVREFESDSKVVCVYGPAGFWDAGAFVNWVSPFVSNLWFRLPFLIGKDVPCGFNVLFRKDAYHRVGGYSEKIYFSMLFDVEIGFRLKRIGKLRFKGDLLVRTSSRHFKKKGYLRFAWQSVDSFIRLCFKKRQAFDYHEYMAYRV